MTDSEKRQWIFNLVNEERKRHKEKWDDYTIPNGYKLVSLVVEELGEFVQGWHNLDVINMEDELIQVIALVCAFLEYRYNEDNKDD